ncbi:hypothetical protein H4R24_002211 [Coemansia sp. RSA 988]|nr:hypothetical protein H4R24_002211 [Coemansia sp. RSA 988]
MGPAKSSEKRGKPNTSPYHVFFQRELKRIKEDNPTMSHKDAFKQAGLNWRTSPQNPKNQKTGSKDASSKNLESALPSETAAASVVIASEPADAPGGTNGLESAAAHAPAPAPALAHESISVPAPTRVSVAAPAPVPAPEPVPGTTAYVQAPAPNEFNAVSSPMVSNSTISGTAERQIFRPPNEPVASYTHNQAKKSGNNSGVSTISSMAAHTVNGATLTAAK